MRPSDIVCHLYRAQTLNKWIAEIAATNCKLTDTRGSPILASLVFRFISIATYIYVKKYIHTYIYLLQYELVYHLLFLGPFIVQTWTWWLKPNEAMAPRVCTDMILLRGHKCTGTIQTISPTSTVQLVTGMWPLNWESLPSWDVRWNKSRTKR